MCTKQEIVVKEVKTSEELICERRNLLCLLSIGGGLTMISLPSQLINSAIDCVGNISLLRKSKTKIRISI